MTCPPLDWRDRRYARRQFLTYARVIAGGAAASAVVPPGVDLEEELTWAEWQREQQHR